MIKQQRLVLTLCGIIFTAGLALWPGRWSLAAESNVTLISFSAISLPGEPEIFIEWETATEFDTVGFFIARSDAMASITSTLYTRISPFIPHEGDTVVGAQYNFIDEDTELNQTYYYRLEVVNTDQSVDYHGPAYAMAGVQPTNTPPATATRTPTATSTPTRTPTHTPSAAPSSTATPTTSAVVQPANPTAPSGSVSIATPRAVSGATITPRPTSSGGPSSPVAMVATPTALPGSSDQPEPGPAAAGAPFVTEPSMAATAVPAPSTGEVALAPAPTLVPADAVPAIVAPVVVVTEAAPPVATANTNNSGPLILIAAAFLFMGIAFLILRQARA